MKYPNGSSSPLKAPAIEPAASSNARIERLLVVDDDEINRDLMSRHFRRAGYLVTLSADGEQALHCIQNEQVDLVLLDLMMPRMSGLELLKILRAKYTSSQLPVISWYPPLMRAIRLSWP